MSEGLPLFATELQQFIQSSLEHLPKTQGAEHSTRQSNRLGISAFITALVGLASRIALFSTACG
jgi:hypothetical protein